MALRSRRVKVGLLLAGVLGLVAAGALGELMKPKAEPDTVVASRFGDVKWNHELHARMKEIGTCTVCHHTERPGETKPRACHDCHKRQTNPAVLLADLHMKVETPKYSGENGPPPMTAFHGKCVGCHKAMKQGPVGCKDCHAQTFKGQHGVVSWDHQAHARRIDMGPEFQGKKACARCHHQDKEATWDGEYRACSACHKPAEQAALKVATGIKSHEKLLHGDCKRCHVVKNPETDGRGCKDCHKGWVVDTQGGARPPVEQAVHARCMDCHRKDWPGLVPGMPVGCNECHRPDQSVVADLEVGLLLWDHDRHARDPGVTCSTCHHTDKPDQPHMACNKCHGTGLYDNPSVGEALRKRCLECHKEKGNGLLEWDQVVAKGDDPKDPKSLTWHTYEGPDGKLTWNHQEHATSWSFSCRNCHHGILKDGDSYASATKAGVTWTGEAARIQKCTACHGETGPVAGSVAEGTKAPPHDAAFKKVCMECHVRLGGGPQTWEAFFAVEPLKRGSEAGAGESR
ncbi:MAG: hypothetical protein AMXMBFR64_31220 [Myxococcales bacterium]